jgi:hypothetical protein
MVQMNQKREGWIALDSLLTFLESMDLMMSLEMQAGSILG